MTFLPSAQLRLAGVDMYAHVLVAACHGSHLRKMKFLNYSRVVAYGAMLLAFAATGARAQMHNMPGMAASPFGIPMDRMGSGTTWIPDAVPIPSKSFMLGKWDMMLHGFVFVQYDKQGGPRGDDQFGSLNWAMLMASHELAGGRFQARTMLSLDPATVSNRGYPLLLQSGETYKGEPIVDRQHPHDFFMELGVLYERAVAGPVGISLYGAPAGEPALGPVAFMHRPSATENPVAPLSHHWQDATHISFGVLTAGLFTKQWKLEGSAFNGREPNEKRWDFDPLKLDSYSGRVTFNPTANLSATAGFGYIASPESLEPEVSVHRVTASLLHSTRVGTHGELASSAVWGANKPEGESKMTNSFLFESRFSWNERNTAFLRAEHVQKKAHDFDLDGPEFGFDEDRELPVSAVSLGYTREVYRARGVSLGLGGSFNLNFIPSELERIYGSRMPSGGLVYVRLRPIGSHGGGMSGMSHHVP